MRVGTVRRSIVFASIYEHPGGAGDVTQVCTAPKVEFYSELVVDVAQDHGASVTSSECKHPSASHTVAPTRCKPLMLVPGLSVSWRHHRAMLMRE